MEFRLGVLACILANSSVSAEMIDVAHNQVRLVEHGDAKLRQYMDRYGVLPRTQKFTYAHVFYNLGVMSNRGDCEHRLMGVYPRRTGSGMLDGFSESVLVTALDKNIEFVQSLELNIQRFLRENRRRLAIAKRPAANEVVQFLITPDVLRIPDAIEEGVFSFLDRSDFIQFGLELTTAVNLVLAQLDLRDFPDLKPAKSRKAFLSINSWHYRMSGRYTLDLTLYGSGRNQRVRLVKRFDATPDEIKELGDRTDLVKRIAPEIVLTERIQADVVWLIVEKLVVLNR